MERKLRHQIGEGLEAVPEDRLARGHRRLRAHLGHRHRPGGHARPGPGGDRVRARLVGGRSEDAAQRIRVLYGGSVKPDNAAEILSQPDVDGAWWAARSLDPEGFARIVAAVE